MPKRVRIIGVPLDLGAGRRGVDMGPSALRVADIDRHVRRLGHEVEDIGDLQVTVPETVDAGPSDMRFADSVLAINRLVFEAVRTALQQDRFPLLLGGDHCVAIGSVAGSGAYLAERGRKLGLIWLDAHGDANTPRTTPSGNIHGMSLALVLGLGDDRFTGLGRPGPKADPRNVALVGVRDLDPGERDNLRQLGVRVFTMRDVDERGMAAVMSDAIRAASDGTAGIHLQLDMDVLDPEEAPGTGTPVPGGITYREAHLAMEMIADAGNLLAMDVVEVNPILGFRNQTAELAVELTLSALGKRIF